MSYIYHMQTKTPELSQTMATNLTADSITWGNSINEGTGRYPSVAINTNGVVVEVHEHHNNDELWYRVGMVDTDSKTINWGSSHKYDTGLQSHVATDDSLNVVENHKSQNHDTLWCHVGKVDADRKTITWGSSHTYDSGTSPSIAIYSNPPCTVEVHKSQSHDTLFYRHGKVDTNSKTIYWGPSFEYDTGKDPQIAVDASGSKVVENHKLEKHDLWCHVGTVDGSTIYWEPRKHYDKGISPRIAISSSGLVVIENHQSQNHETLWYRVGKVDADRETITWGSSHKCDSGMSPSIAINDNLTVIEVHETGSSILTYHVDAVQQ